MKSKILYFISVFIVFLCIWVLAAKYGVNTLEVNCPPMVMDCGDATAYSPIFFLPTIIVQPGYKAPAWPGISQPTAFFALAFGYWFVLANLIVLACYMAEAFFKSKE